MHAHMESSVLYFMFHILNSLTHFRRGTAGKTAQLIVDFKF